MDRDDPLLGDDNSTPLALPCLETLRQVGMGERQVPLSGAGQGKSIVF